jgi:hypothetical protein
LGDEVIVTTTSSYGNAMFASKTDWNFFFTGIYPTSLHFPGNFPRELEVQNNIGELPFGNWKSQCGGEVSPWPISDSKCNRSMGAPATITATTEGNETYFLLNYNYGQVYLERLTMCHPSPLLCIEWKIT